MTFEYVAGALIIGSFAGLLIFIIFQLAEAKHKQQQQDDEQLLDRMVELAEYHEAGESLADTAIRVARQRKQQQRRARQRKAARRST